MIPAIIVLAIKQELFQIIYVQNALIITIQLIQKLILKDSIAIIKQIQELMSIIQIELMKFMIYVIILVKIVVVNQIVYLAKIIIILKQQKMIQKI